MAWARCCRQCPPAARARRCRWLHSCCAFLDRSHNRQVSCQSMPWVGARPGRLLASSLILLAAAASVMIVLNKCNGASVMDTFPKLPQMQNSVSMVRPASPQRLEEECNRSCRSLAHVPFAAPLTCKGGRSTRSFQCKGSSHHVLAICAVVPEETCNAL